MRSVSMSTECSILICVMIVTNTVGMGVNHTNKANLSSDSQTSMAALRSQYTQKEMVTGSPHVLRLFLTGDVMLGRGVDQILPKPCPHRIFERSQTDARHYVKIAEEAHGKLPLDRDLRYVWGQTLSELEIMKPVARIINLETAVTRSGKPWEGKKIHYRVSPENAETLQEINPDGTLVATLANNHAMDWGRSGLEDSLHTLKKLGIPVAGAGRDAEEAASPAVVRVSQSHRVLVFGLGHKSAWGSSSPEGWQADATHSGINILELTNDYLKRFAEQVKKFRRGGDIVVASVHWGGNWGFKIPEKQQAFARQLVDVADVDIVHGHSSHHFKGLELYKGRLLMYGAGDYLNDYEGIRGHKKFKSDIGFMYFVDYDVSNRRVAKLILTPTQLRHFKVQAPSESDFQWALKTLRRECKKFALRVELDERTHHLHISSDDRKSIKDKKGSEDIKLSSSQLSQSRKHSRSRQQKQSRQRKGRRKSTKDGKDKKSSSLQRSLSRKQSHSRRRVIATGSSLLQVSKPLLQKFMPGGAGPQCHQKLS